MSAPYWTYPSSLNGRIEPSCADAQGSLSVYYYGATYYYTYGYSGSSYTYDAGYTYDWDTETDNVFLLGEDTCSLPSYRVHQQDAVYISQATADLTSIDVVYFCWKLLTRSDMPHSPRTLTSDSVEFKNSGIAAYGDGAFGIILPKTFSSGFLEKDSDRIVNVQGTSNDGDYRISSVPWDLWAASTEGVGPTQMGRVGQAPTAARWIGPGDADPAPATPSDLKLYKNGQVAIIEAPSITAETVSGGVTITIPGWRWRGRAYVDGTLRTELYETRAGRGWQRNAMAMHVAKLSGAHTIKFELSLERIDS